MADDPVEEIKEPQPEFKKPVLVGRIGKLPKKAKTEAEKAPEDKHVETPKDTPSESSSKNVLPPAVLLKDIISNPVPYKEPKWSGLCPDGSDYALEVLKSGCIVEKIDLTKKPYHVFGRLSNCDVIMAHPTISRHHCVLQYKAFAAEGEPPPGWYLYDLGSTHGTFLNKDSLKPSHYTRVRVGHQIKFGNSTRTYILLGPDFDCEGESDLTVTEIKQKAEVMRLERDRMIQEAKEQNEKARIEEERKREQQGIDWGMGEDAEDETDLSENPYAITANEDLYLDDPKKTLRGYFEREGHELEYDCQDRGHGQYICRVELPIDDARGRPVVAEAIHSGKKKEAVIACALEACRILDRAGVLRQAKHESRQRRRRLWREDEYEDSDEDTFLDRTGAVERKRERRAAALAGGGAAVGYEDLLKRVQEIETKITTEEKALERLRSTNKADDKQTDGDTDELDAFMKSLQTGGQSMAVKAEISKTKMTIQKLRSELAKANRLADIARPAHLPPLVKKDDSRMAVKMNNSVVYGKRIKLKDDERKPKRKPVEEGKKMDEDFVEEVDSDEEVPQTTKSKDSRNNEKDDSQSGDSKMELETKEVERRTEGNEDVKEGTKEECKAKKVYGPMRPPDNYVIPEDYFNQESDRDLPEIMEKEIA